MRQLWAHIEVKEGFIKEKYEVDQGPARICAGKLAVHSGRAKTIARGCYQLDGETVIIEVENKLALYRPPFSYLLPADPSNPYKPIDVLMVIDSKPYLNSYGLPIRHSTVVKNTMRTIMEGIIPPQLLIADIRSNSIKIIDTSVVELEDPLADLFTYPILGSSPLLTEAKLCEVEKNFNLTNWGRCLEVVAAMRNTWNMLNEFIVSGASHKSLLRACNIHAYLSRKWASMAVLAGYEPLKYAEKAVEKNVLAASLIVSVFRLPGRLRIQTRLPVLVRLLRTMESGKEVMEVRVKDLLELIDDGWTAYAYLCSECWVPL